MEVKSKKNLIVVGNGMTGFKFLEKCIEKGLNKTYQILVFGEEPTPAYDRVHLTDYYTSMSKEQLMLAGEDWYAENNINLYTGEYVNQIEVADKKITTHKGIAFTYDKLVLATGSSAFVPPVDGLSKNGVFVYRTLEDLEAIKSFASKSKNALVVGGGLLGLEAAKAVNDDGLKTFVVELAPRLMPRQLDESAGLLLKEAIESNDIDVILGKSLSKIEGDEGVSSVEFSDGERMDVDMVIFSAGIKARDKVAKESGIETGPRGGIIVDGYMKTSAEDIFAIGECALALNMIWGLVAPCYDMAEVAASILHGEIKEFKGADLSTKLKLIGTDVASFGDAMPSGDNFKTIVYENKPKGIYKRLNITSDGKTLLGGILIGDTEEYNMLVQIAKSGLALPPEPEDLILGSRSGGESLMKVTDLPDDAVVCSCENVSKGTICNTIKDMDLTNLQMIKKHTKAGTGCGGCVPMVDDLLVATLKESGKEVKKVICEHFEYNRQELVDLVKYHKLKNFRETISKVGKGTGCELCKPAVASVLASTWNEPVPHHANIQDTNDRYLANIQRGGTYSVVPRIPGGEISPEKLIVIGQVAQKYNLYTKITGGQRIDMFGAHIHELPDIWEELIEAGFESGHAYGKALRTVKSCVGSAWCRYGQQDSVGFAIEVEERYKGIRAPHKLKGGVSGCIRECAEARGKDFGLIATEKGWNLYVCGNGGANPKHALLLASDIDKETCLKYLDRFLMFYIRTAAPLTRTAKWLADIEGGLDHLKDVIVDDSLGIASELESEMEFLIGTYGCEWKEVVQNPELRARFKHFLNSEDTDENVKFKPVREQKTPVEWSK